MADPNALTEAATTSPDAAADEPAPDRFEGSNYAVDREIARGGMGRIVAAEDLGIGRRVAIKELLLRSPGAAARFEREARLTARLQHPGIVPIYEIGAWADGTPYYSMRMVEGKTLREAIAQCDSLASRLQLLPALIAAAEAVAFAHSRKVIHRDLSPNNVLVGAFGETVVIDWGIAKVIDDVKSDAEQLAEDLETPLDPKPKRRRPTNMDLTVEGSLLGTIAYMPVEQASGLTVDTRADVYTLGALLYHLLAGQPPYQGPDVLEALHAGPPRDLAELVPEAPRDLRSIVAKAMARSADDRYRDAGVLVEELRRFQTGAIVHAHRYTRRERLRRWARRRRGVLIGVVAAAIGAVVATFVIATQKDEVSVAGPTCAELAPGLAGIWDPTLRSGAETAFLTIKAPGASAMFKRLAGALDGYTQELRKSSVESCEATRAGIQSAEIGDWRATCLESRLEEVRALATVMQSSTPALFAMETGVFELTRSSRCPQRDASPLPAIDREKLREVVRHIAKARAAATSGEPLEYLVQATKARDKAKEVGWLEKQAEVGLLLGNALVSTGQLVEGENAYRQTLRDSIAARRDDLAAAAAHQLATLLAAAQARFDEARTFLEVGDAMVERVGDPRLAVAGLQASITVNASSGDPRRAVAAARRALAISSSMWGDNDPMVFAQEFGAGAAMADASLYRQAIPHLERAIALREPLSGPDDGVLTAPRTVLGMAYTYTGRHADAHRELAHALRVRERNGQAYMVVSTLENVADLHLHEGKLEQAAIAIERTLGMTRMLGQHHPVWTQLANTKARVLLAQRKLGEARKLVDEVIAAGRDNPQISRTHAIRAEIAIAEQAWPMAEASAKRAIAGFERTGGAEHPDLWRPLTALGRALDEQGKREDAVPHVRRAQALVATLELTPDEIAALTELAGRL